MKGSIHDAMYSNVGQLDGSFSQHWSINLNLRELNNYTISYKITFFPTDLRNLYSVQPRHAVHQGKLKPQ